jgi:integrase
LHREWAQLEAATEARSVQRPNEELVEITAVEYAHVLLLKDFDQKRSALASMDPEQFAEHRREREQRLEQRKRDVAVGNIEPMLPAARMIVQRERWDLPETDPLFKRFCSMLAEANLATFKTHAARLEGNIHAVSEDPIIRRVGSRRATNAPPGERLIDLVQLYRVTSEREGRKRADTIVQDDKLLRLFAEFVGPDRRVSSISKDEARDFRNTLASAPRSLSKLKAYKGLSLRKAAAKARQDGAQTLNVRTLAKHISTVSPFFDWLVREGYADANCFDGLHPKVPRERKARPPFEPEQLNTLLSSPLFTGFEADRREHLPGVQRARDWRFWIPLVCLFTGARISEVAQLRVRDVEEHGGYWFIHIREDSELGQKTKSRKNRLVAVHPTLEAIGFVKFALAPLGRSSAEPLFPELKPNTRQNIGDRASRFFRRYLEKIGMKGRADGLGSHSFRHSMSGELRGADFDDTVFGPMVLGHASPAPVTAGYGRRTQGSFERLHNMIAAVRFEGVSFDHLLMKDDRSAAA